MTERVAPVLVTLLFLFGAGAPLYAQTLTPAQRARLDGRFERVVRADLQGTLTEAIDDVSDEAGRPGARRRAGRRDVSPKSGAQREQVSALSAPLPLDVRPAGYQRDGTPVYEAMVHTSNGAPLDAVGVEVASAFEGFATVRATPTGLRALSQVDGVTRVQSARRVRLHNDEAAAEVGARTLNRGVGGTPYQGQDVMACVIDSGIDWSHPDFTDASGRTRIHSIWDQADDSTSVPSPAETNDARFADNFNPSYGAEYRTRDVREGDVLQKDWNGHGTHVAGTVASSGNAFKQSNGARKYRGVAPAANIIAVKTAFSINSIIDAVNYCTDVAASEGQPVVVNMSLGTTFGPHDGTAPFARALDAITDEGNGPGSATGSVLIASAGNSGTPTAPIHTSGTVAAGDSADVPVVVSDYESTTGRFNDVYQTSLWTYEDGPYSLSVYSPGTQDSLTLSVEGPTASRDTLVETPRGTISITSASVGAARYFEVQVFDREEAAPPAEGTWTLRLRSEGSQLTDYHGWFLGSSMQAAFQNADNDYTLGIPATARSVIAVGAYVQRNRWASTDGSPLGIPSYERDQTAPFSSRGPTVDGRQKPAITAPGAFTASAFSDDAFGALYGPSYVTGSGEHQLVSGTSMSAPVMAGTAALLLQEDPTLSTNDVRTLVTETARTDDAVGTTWNDTYGFGKLDALGAMTRLRDDLSGSSVEVLAYEDAFGQQAETEEAIGDGGAERLAVRFTPTQTGAVTGMYLSLGASASANDLRDSLVVRIRRDDGSGTPGAPIGDRVAVPSARLAGHTPNFVRLAETEVTVKADSSYHLVLSPKANGGTLDVLAETAGTNAGRSSTYDGSTWSGTGTDAVVRAQVGTGLSTEDRTPPLASGRPVPTATPDSIVLDWGAFSADDVRRYRIYRDTAPIDSAAGPGAVSAFDSVDVSTTRYADTDVQLGTQYYYRVTAVDDAGNESGFTGEATATPRVPPSVAVSPSSVSQTLGLGASSTSTLQVENTAAEGGQALRFSVYLLPEASESSMQAQRPARGPSAWQSLAAMREKAGTTTGVGTLLPHKAPLPVIINDPADDTDDGAVDVTEVRAGARAGSLRVAIEHADPVAPSNYAGVVSFDVDQNASTGTDPIAANPEQVLGSEYAVSFTGEDDVAFLFNTENAGPNEDPQFIAEVPVAVDSSTFHVAVPLSRIDGGLPMNTTGVVGTSESPTDWFPNTGNATIEEIQWVDVSPQSGDVPGGDVQDVTLSFDASRLEARTYDATLRIESNDPDNATIDVPVSMTVEGLSAPSGLTATTDGADVSLSWEPSTGGSVAQYNVYRRTARIPDNVADLSPVASVSGQTSFTDTTATAGRTYHYRVSAVDGGGNETALSSERSVFLYPETVAADVSRSFGGVGDASGYRLVALPGAVNRPLADAIDGQAGLDWQAYWDDGASLVQFAQSDAFTFQPGRGFWLTSAEEWTVQAEIETVPLRGDTATAIPVHDGWNIVSNPTGKPVSLRALQRANPEGAVQLVGFDGTFQLADTMRSARTGVAYYFLNDAGRDSLTIPYPGAPTKQKGDAASAGDGDVVLAARRAGAPADAASTVRIGLDPAARTGLDAGDIHAPPGRFEDVSLRLDAPGSDRPERQDALLIERRPPPSGTGAEAGRTFSLQLRTQSDGPVRLDVQNLDALGDRAAALLNTATGKTNDLQANRSLTLDPTGETTSLKVAVGTPGYVQEQAEAVVPDEVALTSYPNPMHQQGTLEYAVPKETTVRLEVYDLLGRKVATLVDRRKDAGRYRVQMETDRLSSGVYFGRLRTDGQTRTQKITVVR